MSMEDPSLLRKSNRAVKFSRRVLANIKNNSNSEQIS